MGLDKLTVKELRKLAADNDINLQGRDKKQDIIDTIVEAGFESEPSAESGVEHEKAIEKDRAATLKAMK